MSKLQVVARFKSDDAANPRFTKTTTIEELMVETMKTLPIDMIYLVTPDQDGRGYSLRELGLITIDIATPSGDQLPNIRPEPIVTQQTVQDAPGQEISVESMPEPIPVKEVVPQVILDNDTGFKFDRPRSQTELLAERGIEEPKKNLARKARKRKSIAPDNGGIGAQVAASGAMDVPEESLPNPVSKGRVQINNIITATPEQAAAASQFGRH